MSVIDFSDSLLKHRVIEYTSKLWVFFENQHL